MQSATHQAPPEASEFISRKPMTLVDLASDRLAALCRAAGFGPAGNRAVGVFRALVSSWASAPLDRYAAWRSEISDDHTPFELSVSISDSGVEVRALIEPQALEPSISAYRAAAIAFHRRLEREFGASLARFDCVADLFLPPEMQGPFALWSSVVFSPEGPPAFKAYFNPQARGPALARALVEEALQRLGLPHAAAALNESALRRGPDRDELKYFALDLSNDAEARVKVYVRHHGVTPSELEQACSLAKSYCPGEVLAFARAMSGVEDRLMPRAATTCSAFVDPCSTVPDATTLYIPVCAYAESDAVVRRRVSDYLLDHGLDPGRYQRVVDGYANRPLKNGIGMQSWVALRHRHGQPRLTVYLATEARRVYAPGAIPAATPDLLAMMSVREIARRLREYALETHPFIQRLGRERMRVRELSLLIATVYDGIAKDHTRRLGAILAQTDDERLRQLLAGELARGDLSSAFGQLMRILLDATGGPRSLHIDEPPAPGARLAERFAQHSSSSDSIEAVGALLAGALGSAQLIRAVTALIPRHLQTFDGAVIERVEAHAAVHDHLAWILESLVPARAGAVTSARRGSMGVHLALWRALDELYARCYRPARGG